MTDGKILDRVRQLLAMAADTSSPHEAAIAAGRARKLMDQHQIDLSDLKEASGFGFEHVTASYRFMPKWMDILAVGVARFNDCKAIRTHEWQKINASYSYRITFQGFESDVVVGKAMYDYLITTVERLCKAYLAPMGYKRYPAKLGDAYKKAAASELCSRLSEMQKAREAEMLIQHGLSAGRSLVVVKMAQVEAEFGEFKTRAVTLHSRAGDDVDAAKARGREDAKNIAINRMVTDNAKVRLS